MDVMRFGSRRRVIDAIGPRVIEVETPCREVPTAETVTAGLAANPDAELLSVVHVEAPCGMVAPIAEIGRLCQAAGVVSHVDEVASVGGVDRRADEWQLDIVVTAPEKCLSGPTGCRCSRSARKAWELVAKNPGAPRRTLRGRSVLVGDQPTKDAARVPGSGPLRGRSVLVGDQPTKDGYHGR